MPDNGNGASDILYFCDFVEMVRRTWWRARNTVEKVIVVPASTFRGTFLLPGPETGIFRSPDGKAWLLQGSSNDTLLWVERHCPRPTRDRAVREVLRAGRNLPGTDLESMLQAAAATIDTVPEYNKHRYRCLYRTELYPPQSLIADWVVVSEYAIQEERDPTQIEWVPNFKAIVRTHPIVPAALQIAIQSNSPADWFRFVRALPPLGTSGGLSRAA